VLPECGNIAGTHKTVYIFVYNQRFVGKEFEIS
jgi:hypothetical protein